jgi:formamidopyrimidine-DNA glycosylase
MPELPEVETIKRDLQVLTHDTIVSEHVYRSSVYRRKTPTLVGIFFVRITRTAKLLQFELSNGDWLLIHLKMTGQIILIDGGVVHDSGYSKLAAHTGAPTKHTAVTYTFASGRVLQFDDIRKFGYIEYVSQAERALRIARYGIEPLTPNFTLQTFQQLFGTRSPLKALLLNQQRIAGLGNIYIDEICFRAGVLPSRLAHTLTDEEQQALFTHTEPVLREAIRLRGTTFRNYTDTSGASGGFESFLQVYGRQGRPCFVCGTPIIRQRVAGRGTHVCLLCQK